MLFICYSEVMQLSTTERQERLERSREAIKLHEIEGNPFTPEENAMFDMFDREGWTDAQCRNYITERIKKHNKLPEHFG